MEQRRPLMPAPRRLKQEELGEFETNLVHIVRSRPASSVEWGRVSTEKRRKVTSRKNSQANAEVRLYSRQDPA